MKSLSFNQIKIENNFPILTGNKLFDQWFSSDGGIIRGSNIFVTGTSGAGKTTLMINIMNWLKEYKSSFYSREMSISSLKHQIKNYNFDNPNAYFIDEQNCPHLDNYISELDILKPDFVIVDSMQAIAVQDYPEMSEEKASVLVREKITKWCKVNNATLFLIGHNTKDNEFAGKNTNMQMVDAHMVLEYDKKTDTRTMYWGKKNRKGPMGSLKYKIDQGSIVFFDNNSVELSFVDNFHEFLTNFMNRVDSKSEKYNIIKNEINNVSDKIYDDYSGDEFNYMTRFLPEVYRIFSKYGFN